MTILSEIIRFILPPTKATATEFHKLRQHVAQAYGVRDQYFGSTIRTGAPGVRVRGDEMCWVIHWPQDSSLAENAELKAQLKQLTLASSEGGTTDGKNRDVTSLLFQFEDSQVPGLKKALESPLCEFAIINLTPNHPRGDAAFATSMHKTFTDCYYTKGFVGGNWAYALNTVDKTEGVVVPVIDDLGHGGGDAASATATSQDKTAQRKGEIPQDERRLACYYLGWETVEDHRAYTKTPLFWEEIDKLSPYFAPETGAWYVKFEKH
ncbi:hypothetical protein Z517_10987 [Fonsecaea pedrosoi CBS 271.37]|uniref:Uncharacterized protein n=1 Tax=Fonsecaea pedrosoi CBS 271.37 TaxID=1442368 RepID=A0A0D2DEW8_9EURO|nr:uncharacterized protein Z517_10987 [Fonsecaea pedrosoi CBS 271.37]KIW76241.1 hypothetical protein Z517_10987 [Fonsecaea pedrosoi CBS 271.37]